MTHQQFTDFWDEARYLGEVVAFLDNKQAETGCSGTSDWARMRHALDRLGEILDASDDPDRVYAAYADGYDETIDFSLNAEWRHATTTADDDAFPF